MGKIGRNDPCFCGSGKKFKKCHLLKPQETAATIQYPPVRSETPQLGQVMRIPNKLAISEVTELVVVYREHVTNILSDARLLDSLGCDSSKRMMAV